MAAPLDVSFDLVVATLGRTAELDGLLASVERQGHRAVRVLVVDQNTDDRLEPVLAAHPSLSVSRLASPPGLSRARNAALALVEADVVGFPDDDCSYPADLLERLAGRFAADPGLDGLTGRTVAPDGTASARWPPTSGLLAPDSVWHRCNSASMFLRRELVAATGPFDEQLGLGSGTPWSSGEEIDLVARALAAGARIEYDPSLVVVHPRRAPAAGELRALGRRDGGSVGYVLAKNGYPARVVARMLVRPLGGAAISLARLDHDGARFHLAAWRGRLAGYAAGRRVASSSAKSAS